MKDSLWSNCSELRRKRIPGTGRSTVGGAGSRSRYDIYSLTSDLANHFSDAFSSDEYLC